MHALHNRFEMEQSDWNPAAPNFLHTVSLDPLFWVGRREITYNTASLREPGLNFAFHTFQLLVKRSPLKKHGTFKTSPKIHLVD